MSYKSPFSAGYDPSAKINPDGRVVIKTVSGEDLYLETGDQNDAVHGNPGFEDQTAGVPDVWEFFFGVGSPTITSDTAVVLSGDRSLRIDLAAGGSTQQIVLSDVIDVTGGQEVPFAGYLKKTFGSPVATVGMLTRNGGTPTPVDVATIYNESPASSLTTDWALRSRRMTVPTGHTKARLFFRVAPAATEACTVYVDLTSSSIVGSSEYDSGWIALPFNTNWSNAGFGWSNCEYRRKGDDLILRGLAARSTSASGADAVIATLPDGFRPTTIRLLGDSYLTSASLPTASMITIDSSGQIVTKASVPSGAYVALEKTVAL